MMKKFLLYAGVTNYREMTTEILERILPLIAQWYAGSRRPLPWRLEPTPYHVWLSEIMLQQTRIEAVIPYYERFLKEFPTVQALAQAEDERLMKLWEGLGYYSRARNLKKAAVQVIEHYEGTLPREASELKKLPGIGEYTAGAIASIAYGQPEPAVDGNVLRVVTRLLACEKDIQEAKTKALIKELLRQSYPSGRDAALLTEGIMELGETVCVPNGEARCTLCPVKEYCLAHQTGTVDRYPVKAPKKARRIEERTVFLLRCGGKYAICKRAENGLLAGLWEFPNTEGKLGAEGAVAYAQTYGMAVTACVPCGRKKHVFTHVEWHMEAYLVDCSSESEAFIWKRPQEIQEEFSVPTAFRSFLRFISDEIPAGDNISACE